ncbi:MAG: hypothetical protein WCY33_02525 [Clostridia bacterium]
MAKILDQLEVSPTHNNSKQVLFEKQQQNFGTNFVISNIYGPE